MLNKIILMGRICHELELKRTQSGTSYCNFRVAVERDTPDKQTGERQTDFINCETWGGTAEFVSRYFSKGKMIIVEGRLKNNDYTDKNGVKHYSMNVLSNNVHFGEPKGDASGSHQQTAQQPQPQQQHQTYPNQYSQPVQAAQGYNNGYNNDYYQAQPPERQHGSGFPPMPNENIGDLSDFEEILCDGDVPF